MAIVIVDGLESGVCPYKALCRIHSQSEAHRVKLKASVGGVIYPSMLK